MIKCLKIEDFVIEEMFCPYTPSLIPGEFQSQAYMDRMEKKLRLNPEYIIDILEKDQETKQRVFNRLQKFGGVKFYRYLDMNNPVIQYVKENLACEQIEIMEE